MKQLTISIFFLITVSATSAAQPDRWQQRVEYEMSIDFDVNTNQFTGTQSLKYFNNSPDTLDKVFYHLYFNAFQPGSMMDVRSRLLPDPSPKIADKILYYDETEIGYHKVNSLMQDGESLDYHVEGTILEVELAKPLLPGTSTVFEMEFDSQVPLQTRRSGRDNAEGIRYSMSQWFPKLAEYDYQGWHAHPYVAREFYAPWGDYDVKITIDRTYMIGGTGYLQNPNEIGHGYDNAGSEAKKGKNGKLTWHFKADNVHDFMWAADPDYAHDIVQVPNGPELHFFYQADTLVQNWKKLQPTMVKAYQFMNKEFGKYPYDQYAFVQGGDGGMEYPMATLITGYRSFRSLVGVSVHEGLHSWYQMVLGTNESYYAWMDEGYTSWATNLTMHYLFDEEDGANYVNPIANSYRGYYSLVKSGLEEPLSTHSDHFETNRAYGTGSYGKGAMSVHQLGYILGQDLMKQGMRRYYHTWKFKHPNKIDFIRVMEKESGLELDWYYDYWINTTHTIDYGIADASENNGSTQVTLERVGKMPMPVELVVTYEDDSQETFYIALGIMRGEKKPDNDMKWTILSDWPWVNPEYTLEIPRPISEIKSMEIDPTQAMADIDRSNNVYPNSNKFNFLGKKK
ncbi:MAG: M1 family metallopeptidase [Bacteroidota bacterium]